MNICFYTNANPSATSVLNMNHLVHARPMHNYSFVRVASAKKKISFTDKLKNYYSEARFNDGRYDFQRDSMLFEKRISGHVQQVNMNDFRQAFAGAVNDMQSRQILDEIKPDIIVQAGAGILDEGIFSRAGIATINVHHGLAPEIRGILSTFWCMFYGIKDKIGVTCHMIDAGLDTGAVVSRRALITAATSYVDIEVENYLMGREVLVDSIDILGRNNYSVASKGQVKSYYFGVPDNFLYYSLKKRNFHPLMKISQKAFTMKDLNIIA